MTDGPPMRPREVGARTTLLPSARRLEARIPFAIPRKRLREEAVLQDSDERRLGKSIRASDTLFESCGSAARDEVPKLVAGRGAHLLLGGSERKLPRLKTGAGVGLGRWRRWRRWWIER